MLFYGYIDGSSKDGDKGCALSEVKRKETCQKKERNAPCRITNRESKQRLKYI